MHSVSRAGHEVGKKNNFSTFAALAAFVRHSIRANPLNSCQTFCDMTTANKITILRILLIPVFIVETLYYVKTGNEVHRLVAILAFAITAILDGVDGYIARHYNQISELGKILDPLADKLLLVSAIVILSFDNSPRLGQIPLWLTGTIIGRDLIILIGVIIVRSTVGKLTVHPRLTGKIATVYQMIAVVWILLRWDFIFHRHYLKIWIVGADIFTAASGLLYVWDGMKQLGSHPSSSPAKKGETCS
jgi:CDP-diacylglycerol--glycerol-3-phosphate 3-phosphatidyltransferase